MSLKRLRVLQFEGNRTLGIAARSIAELKRKAIQYLNLNELEDIVICSEDGTLIEDDEYFEFLPDNQNVTALPRKDVPRLVSQQTSLRSTRHLLTELVTKIENINDDELRNFLDKKDIKRLRIFVERLESTRHLTTKQEDPDWFEGCQSSAKTKEQYLRNCAKGRIRSYLLDFKERWAQYVSKETVDEDLKWRINNCAARMKEILSEHQYYSCYFDRRDQNCRHRYCDVNGTFICQGRYNEDLCDSEHSINPYDNKESRILFRTWNLDHVTERHVIIRAFVEAAVRFRNGNEISERRLMRYLFERENLKFVHNSCHVISLHNNVHIDHTEFFQQ